MIYFYMISNYMSVTEMWGKINKQILHSWRYWKDICTWSWANASWWPFLGRGGYEDGLL